MESFLQECIETHPPDALKGLILKFRQVASHSHVLAPVVEPNQILSRHKKVNIHGKKKPRGSRKQTRDPIHAEMVKNKVKMAAMKRKKVATIANRRNARRQTLQKSGSESAAPTNSDSNLDDQADLELEEGASSVGRDDSNSLDSSLEELDEMFPCCPSPGIIMEKEHVGPTPGNLEDKEPVSTTSTLMKKNGT